MPLPVVTLRDVALAAGVSVNTASRALRAGTHASPSARAAVAAAAAKLGYRPDPMLAALNHYRGVRRPAAHGRAVAFVNEDFPSALERTAPPFLQAYFQGCAEQAARLGYSLSEFRPVEHRTRRRALEVLSSRGVGGLVFAPLRSPAGRLPIRPIDGFSAVTLGRTVRAPVLHAVTADGFAGMQLALHALKRAGRRRVGLVLHAGHDMRTMRAWSSAYLGWWHARRAEAPPPLYLEETDDAKLVEWLRAGRFDAVVTSEPQSLEILRRVGVRVPDELAFVVVTGADHHPGVTGIAQPFREIGRRAFSLLHRLLLDDERGAPLLPSIEQVTPIWVEGRTL